MLILIKREDIVDDYNDLGDDINELTKDRVNQIKKFLINKYRFEHGFITVDGEDHRVTFDMTKPTSCDSDGDINFGLEFEGKDNDLQLMLQHEIGHKTLGHRRIYATGLEYGKYSDPNTDEKDILSPEEALTKMIAMCTKNKGVTPLEFLVGPKYQKGLSLYNKLAAWFKIGQRMPLFLAGGAAGRKVWDSIPYEIKDALGPDLLKIVISLISKFEIKGPTDSIGKSREKNYEIWNKESMKSANPHVFAYEAEADAYAMAHMDPRAIAHMKHPLEPIAKIYGLKINKNGEIEIPKNIKDIDGFVRQLSQITFAGDHPEKFKPLVDALARIYKVSTVQDLQYRINCYNKTSNTEEGKIYKDINPRKVDRKYEYEDKTSPERLARQEEIARRSAEGYRRREELAKSIKEKENKK